MIISRFKFPPLVIVIRGDGDKNHEYLQEADFFTCEIFTPSFGTDRNSR